MNIDDLPTRKSQPLIDMSKEDLSTLSIDELEERIAILEGEIVRVKADIKAKGASRLAAENAFK